MVQGIGMTLAAIPFVFALHVASAQTASSASIQPGAQRSPAPPLAATPLRPALQEGAAKTPSTIAAPSTIARVPYGCDRLVSPLTKTTAANLLGRCIT